MRTPYTNEGEQAIAIHESFIRWQGHEDTWTQIAQDLIHSGYMSSQNRVAELEEELEDKEWELKELTRDLEDLRDQLYEMENLS